MIGAIKVEAFLANLALFHGLPELELERLAAATTRRKVARGRSLFREGEPATGLWAVVYGRIELVSVDDAGRASQADLIGPGQTFGETVMLLERPYKVRARAVADALVLHVARTAVLALLEREPAFALRLVRTLAERIEWLVRERGELALGTARERLLAWLLRRPELAQTPPAVIRLPTAKRVLAVRLGFRPEHFSRVLRELASAGLVEVHGREITIADPAALRACQAGECPHPRRRTPARATAAGGELAIT